MAVVGQITAAIESVEGVKLLNVDPGAATNRTVVTFVGEPEAVTEAAFRAVRRATEVIDMRHHKGEHPRIGATDVLPLIPVAGISMEETAEYARRLAERIGTELSVPVYCYDSAAYKPERRNLATCRAGEYEGLAKKLTDAAWQPDYGPAEFSEHVARTGLTVVGARNFLVAVNFNLNTTSTRRANAIAFDVREKGRPQREGNPITGKIVKDPAGNPVMIPGTLKGCKAIGWYIEEYRMAQVSMNITDINATSLHEAYEEVVRAAAARGVKVTGVEIVGLVPKSVLVDAGRYFLHKQQRSTGIAEDEIVRIAVKSMGLDELRPFDPREKVIEYMLEDHSAASLVDMTCRAFSEETASESAAPGGGSVSAYVGAMGAALATMVANLSAHKAGWDERWEAFSDWADRGHDIMVRLLHLVDEDTAAFNRIMGAFGLPKSSDSEKAARKEAIEIATRYATEVPFRTMQTAMEAFDVARAMAAEGNPNSASDAGVGALCIRTAILGAGLNVKINAAGLKDREFADRVVAEAEELITKANLVEAMILEVVNSKING